MQLFNNSLKTSLPIASVIVAASLMSCNKDKHDQPQTTSTTYGSYVKIGEGQAHTFIIKNPDGSTKTMGFNFTETALSGLPDQTTAFILPMPPGNQTLIDHVSLDYSPHGHEPDGIYNVPHFDAHFYMISENDQNSITVTDPRIDILPPAGVMPKNYIAGSNEPKMGKHWADTTAAEFHGKKFTHTFIYGTFDGKVIFYEPMLALDYIKTKPNESFDIKSQGTVQKTGLYPQEYTIQWQKDRKEYIISMDQLTLRQQN